MSRRWKLVIAVIVVAAIAVVGGPFVYINFVREPAADSFVSEATTTSIDDTTAAPSAVPASLLSDATGTWNVVAESQVGYRVNEVLFGQRVTAVGRTSAVTGTVTIADLTVTDAKFTADMTTVKSDDPRRDAQFESRIMDVLNYPSASFELASPITIDPAALAGTVTHQANGSLTLRGVTKPVNVTIVSTVQDTQILLAGEIAVVFAEWAIPNPSIPGISTEDSGVLEFQLVLSRS
jgi:polyisoprenoid-binding protein YceI